MKYSIPYFSAVTVRIYNLSGKLVKTLMNNENHSAGMYDLVLETNQMSSGIYFIHLDSSNAQIVKKITVVK